MCTARITKRLILNADDFAFTAGVTDGILEAHAAGAVTSTSMMVACDGWEDGVRRARATPSLGVGLHFNVLVGAPLTRAPSLTDVRTGRFLSLGAIVRKAVTGALDAGEIRAECEAQLAALAAAGIAVTHVDSHRHVHALPGIRHAVAAVAAERALPLRRPVESHPATRRWRSALHRGAIAAAWRAGSAGAAATRSADHFCGVSLQGAPRFAQNFIAALDALDGGTTEMMMHPGHVDEALRHADSYTTQRERELSALVSPVVYERLRQGDFLLIGFASL